MDWTNRMNLVMDYVEEHLCDDIMESDISRLAFCPYSAFQTSFSQITGITFSEYIRRRKLTCAAYDLQNTDITPYGGGTWAIVKSDGSNDKIKEISGKFFDLGLCFGFQQDGSDDYMCAIEWDGDAVEGFDTFTYPAATWLIFEAKGAISDNVLGNVWNRINNEFLPGSKYKKCMATIEKYVYWNEAEDACHVEIWIPVEEIS